MNKISLPIDIIIPDLLTALKEHNCLIIEASPGSGKTTRVPPAMLAREGEVWVLEPRRLAARMAAHWVASTLAEKLAETVGYQVRFDEVSGPKTRLRFLTEGVFTRKLLSDATLKSVGTIILDEFHERHLQTDVALALIRQLQKTSRPDLRLIIMSATLDSHSLIDYLDNCPVLTVSGNNFDVEIKYQPYSEQTPLAKQIAQSVNALLTEKVIGDILVFLPGAAEIRRAKIECENLKKDLLIVPLHGDLSSAEQDQAVQLANKQKVILSTNIAESSITIAGISAVIDSGLARIAEYSPWSGLPILKVSRISKASAIQRAGRAGRLSAGKCLRLYNQQDFESRAQYEKPEIERADLTELVLTLKILGINDPSSLPWLQPPPKELLENAAQLLIRLGAIKENAISPLGYQLSKFAVHPRQARIILAADQRGYGSAGALLAALINARDIRSSSKSSFNNHYEKNSFRQHSIQRGPSDLLLLFDLFQEVARSNFSADKIRSLALDYGAVAAVDKIYQQLIKQLKNLSNTKQHSDDLEKDLLIAILTGYPDRVAKVRRVAGKPIELLISNGTTAQLSENSVVSASEFVVAIDIEERQINLTLGTNRTAISVRIASEIEIDWLLDNYLEFIKEEDLLLWNDRLERVEQVQRLIYDQLIIDETVTIARNNSDSTKILIAAAKNVGIDKFIDREEWQKFAARLAILQEAYPEHQWPVFSDQDLTELITPLAKGLTSFAELRTALSHRALIDNLSANLTEEARRLLHQMVPEKVVLPNGRQAKVEYHPGKPPMVASRLQDFFGAKETPKIAGGRISLVLSLLAPNQRPVQVTSDLAGFWQRTYPQIRKELSRRYPKHAWPEDPLKPLPQNSEGNKR